jgi:hypothetical protein
MAGGLLALAAAAGIYFAFFRRAPTITPTIPAAAPAAPMASEPKPLVLGRPDEAIALPPLDETDAIVRKLVSALSRDPLIGRWLATSSLIRNFAVAVTNVADGTTPARALTALQPGGSFQVVQRGSDIYIDPATYRRYDAMARAASAIDPSDAAHLFAQLKPAINEAYLELGVPNRTLDQTVAAAIVRLLRTPVVEGPVRVLPKPKGIGYRYADDRLEDLSAAQRQLLRMGPENVARIQLALRRIALALGMDERDLPPAPNR